MFIETQTVERFTESRIAGMTTWHNKNITLKTEFDLTAEFFISSGCRVSLNNFTDFRFWFAPQCDGSRSSPTLFLD